MTAISLVYTATIAVAEPFDATQGMDDCLETMDGFSREMGRRSGRFRHAEGWRRHAHYGFCDEAADPLRVALGRRYCLRPDADR